MRVRTDANVAELQLLGTQLIALREDHRLHHAVLELSYIAGPRIPQQRLFGLCSQPDAFLVLDHKALEEVARQMENVVRPLAQGRHVEWHNVEAMVEILSKATGFDLRSEIAVRRCENPHIDSRRASAAHRRELLFLDEAEQLALHLQGQLSHLVEKNRAVGRICQPTDTPLLRAGEGTSLVTEELTLDQ